MNDFGFQPWRNCPLPRLCLGNWMKPDIKKRRNAAAAKLKGFLGELGYE